MDYTYQDIAKMIDHSLLNHTLTVEDLKRGCRLALDYDCASVCIMPYALRTCADILQGSAVKASTTIGFPGWEFDHHAARRPHGADPAGCSHPPAFLDG